MFLFPVRPSFPWLRLGVLTAGLWMALAGISSLAAETERGDAGCQLGIDKTSGFQRVDEVAEKSPAAEAGLRVGDEVVAVDGNSTKGLNPDEVQAMMEGAIGSGVTLTLRSAGATDGPVTPPRQLTITRRSIPEVYLAGATDGDAKAQFFLGDYYIAHPTNAPDYTQARAWYRKAADQGMDRAQTQLGYLYQTGLGAPVDLKAAAEWYLKAAMQGDRIGERKLGVCYFYGNGVKQSDKAAFAWLYAAAMQDDMKAERGLGNLYRNGRGTAKDNAAAFAWFYRSAEQGDAYAQLNLGSLYEIGLGTKPSSLDALIWYRKAQAGLPPVEGAKLKKTVAILSLRSFLENPNGDPNLDLSLFLGAFQTELIVFFLILLVIYGVGGGILFYFSLRSPPRLWTSLGWIVFFLEGQGVAFVALCVLGATISAATLVSATALFCAVPLVLSTCGTNRGQIWRASAMPLKLRAAYAVAAVVTVFLLNAGYEEIYGWLAHSDLPAQATGQLIDKAKGASAWLAYLSIALLMPMAEEILFRSYLFEALRRRFSGGVTVGLTAFAFALCHFQANYFIPLFVMGLAVGWLKLKTDSLRLPVLLHVLNNGLALFWSP